MRNTINMPIKAVSVPPFRGDHSQSMTPQFHGSPLFPAGGGERPSAEYHQLAQDPGWPYSSLGNPDGKYQPMDIPQP
jgi:hypothetical protein